MLCPNCGNNIPDNSKFCSECGSKLDPLDNSCNELAEHDKNNAPADIMFSSSKAPEDENNVPQREKRIFSKGQRLIVILGSLAAVFGIVLGILLVTDSFGDKTEKATEPPAKAQVISSAEDVKIGSGNVDISGIMDSVKKDGFQAETPAGILYESMSNLFTDTSAFEFNLDIFCSEDFDGVSGEVVFGKDAKSSLFHLELEDKQPLELLIWDNSLYKKSVNGTIPSYMRVDFVYDDVFRAWENTYAPDETQPAADLERCEFTLFSFVYGLFDGVLSTVMKGVFGLVLPNAAALVESLDNYFYAVLDENGNGNGVYGDITTSENNGLTTYTFDFGLSQFTNEAVDYVEGEVPQGENYKYYANAAELSYRAFMLALLNKDGFEYAGTYSPAVTVSLTVGNSRLRELDVSCQGKHIMKLTLNYEFTLNTDELEALVNSCPAPTANSTAAETQTD